MTDKRREKQNRMAQRALSSIKLRTAFDDAWYLHSRMFGPIMEPAFKDDAAARFELTAALNLMSRDEHHKALKKLDRLHDFCRTDDDFAAWYFFMGVCGIKLGFRDRAMMMLTESSKLEPDFYMVYLMLGRCLQESRHYEVAVSAYAHTVEKIVDAPPRDEVPAIDRNALLGSLHGNMATCYVMMRLYGEAEYELYEAQSYGYSPPLMSLTWAILYAATDRKTKAREEMAKLRAELPEAESKSVLNVEEIISGRNPHFTLQKIDVGRLEGFWEWFCERETYIKTAFRTGFAAFISRELDAKLYELFGYKDESVYCLLDRDKDKISVGFFDNYSLTNEIWLEKMIDLAPKKLKKSWSFYSAH